MPYKADHHLISVMEHLGDGINIKEKRALRLTIQGREEGLLLLCGGDSPQYSWTLDGRSLTDTELLSVNTETNSITLRQHVSGAVACSVRNNVSQVSKGEEISNCGFIFINCSSNGTQISQWVFAANNTLCVEPTTTSPTTIIPESSTAGKESTVSINPCNNITSWNQTVTPLSEDDPWYINHSLLVCAVRAAVVVFALIGIAVYFAWKNKNYKKAEGLETHCDSRQDGAQCFGPLGGTVVLQLIDRALQTERYKLYKSFRLNNLSRNDSAEYHFEISDGINIKEKRALRLTIQGREEGLLLLWGGDSPQYSWTLDGRSLTDTELLSVNTETNSITLRQHVSGAVACSVRNNVSQVSKGEEISNCGFIFINCSSNGTQISQWVFAANNTLCVEPTTTSPTTIIPESSTAGLETYCDSRQDGAQCFGPLGGTVVLQLIDRALQTERYKLYKSSNETTVILL
ncbi:hypothetical protein F7725_010029 [Dissostichus mawsoni]|uniref:Uncharacterized protein n=1 Tax=Dissostichus mawsoni TaxID=36200 RepID=A0A7J5XMS8_DISMA|nr:hypothetical protein F7725_010029 [Dissostichus mawsoni]